MNKDTFYFSHDYNARMDDKIRRLIRKHGMEGYGIFWAIIEDLYNNANALRLDCEGIAFDLHTPTDIVKSIINDFDLFVIENNIFGSISIERRLSERNEKSEKARQSAFSRWNKAKTNANALRLDCEGIAIKERKGKNKKENNTDLFSETFEIFRKQYPGTKLGHKMEFDNFIKKNKPELVNLLLPGLEREITFRKKRSELKSFVPDWKNLSTWINQKCWEQEYPEIEPSLNGKQSHFSKNGVELQSCPR